MCAGEDRRADAADPGPRGSSPARNNGGGPTPHSPTAGIRAEDTAAHAPAHGGGR